MLSWTWVLMMELTLKDVVVWRARAVPRDPALTHTHVSMYACRYALSEKMLFKKYNFNMC